MLHKLARNENGTYESVLPIGGHGVCVDEGKCPVESSGPIMTKICLGSRTVQLFAPIGRNQNRLYPLINVEKYVDSDRIFSLKRG